MTLEALMLSENQQKNVWENWLSSEIRANYFADLSAHYQARQRALTWIILVFSSSALVSLVSGIPSSFGWVKPLLAFLTTCASILSLVEQDQKNSWECSDLHFRWHRLAGDYEALWDDMYSQDALKKMKDLDDRRAELSKSGNAIPYKKRRMLKWQNYVEQHHGFPAAV